jgi:hypothetical protein
LHSEITDDRRSHRTRNESPIEGYAEPAVGSPGISLLLD